MNMAREGLNSNNEDFCEDSFQIWKTAGIP